MAERILPTINPFLLPTGRVVTGQNPESGALQEIIIDSQFQLSIYDPDAQSSDVQSQFAGFDAPRMASLGLRASGTDWRVVKTVLNSPESPVAFDERLDNTLFALSAVGYCFRLGLLRAQAVPGNRGSYDVGPFSASEKRALTLAAKGRVEPHDERTLKMLKRLDQEYTTEPNLLSLLTKAVVLELGLEQPQASIVYVAAPSSRTPIPTVMQAPELESVPDPEAEPEMVPKPEEVSISVVEQPLPKPESQPAITLRPGRRLSSLRAPAHLKTEATFEIALQRFFQVHQPTRHTVDFRGAEITLDYKDQLSDTLGAIATQHAFGLTMEQMFGLDISPTKRESFHHMRAFFGLDDTEKRAERVVGQLFTRGFVENVNLTNYLPNRGTTRDQEHLLHLLTYASELEIKTELGLSHRELKIELLRLCGTFESSHLARVIWAANLSKYLPGLEQITS